MNLRKTSKHSKIVEVTDFDILFFDDPHQKFAREVDAYLKAIGAPGSVVMRNVSFIEEEEPASAGGLPMWTLPSMRTVLRVQVAEASTAVALKLKFQPARNVPKSLYERGRMARMYREIL